VHFLAIFDFGEGLDLASEMDDQKGEASSAAVGCVLLPWFRPEPTVCDVSGDPIARASGSHGVQKNGLRLLRSGPDGLVRSQGAPSARSVVRGHADFSGIGGAAH
jgi:hypothetical protein